MFHIIANLQSGKKSGKSKSAKALKKVEKILQDKNIEYAIHSTEYKGHATEIARELSHTPDTKILMLGGDGSFNEILNGIDNFENVTLGFVPCGTGNDFVSATKYPKKVDAAMKLILKGNEKYIDFIQLNDRRCLNVLGAGMDVDVLLKYEEMKCFHGKFKYFASLIYTLIHKKEHRLRLQIDDGEPMEKCVFMIGIGNGKSIGGGLPICPHAVHDDGKLSIVVVNDMKKSKIPFRLPSFLTGRHVYKSFSEEYEGTKIKINVLDDSQFEVDGEVFQSPYIECHIVTKTLKVFG